MGAKYLGSYVGMARPILVERDYQAVKRLLVDRCKGIYLLLEAERLEALIRELTLYEDRSGERERSSGSLSAASTAPQATGCTDVGPTRTEPGLQHAPARARCDATCMSQAGPGRR